MEKEYLNQFRERELWSFLGIFISDDRPYFQSSVFSFLPKKIKIKEQRYRVRYEWFDDGWTFQSYWGKWNWYWEFNQILKW